MEASFANGGQLSASNASMDKMVNHFQRPEMDGESDAPLLVNPKPSLHKFGWMMEFMSNIPNYNQTPSAPPRWRSLLVIS